MSKTFKLFSHIRCVKYFHLVHIVLSSLSSKRSRAKSFSPIQTKRKVDREKKTSGIAGSVRNVFPNGALAYGLYW